MQYINFTCNCKTKKYKHYSILCLLVYYRLLDQINLQKVYLDQVSKNIMDIQYKEKFANCSNRQKPNLNEFAHKSTMENLQEQVSCLSIYLISKKIYLTLL